MWVNRYIFTLLNVISKENIGLYRDDELGIFRNTSDPDLLRYLAVMACLLRLKQT